MFSVHLLICLSHTFLIEDEEKDGYVANRILNLTYELDLPDHENNQQSSQQQGQTQENSRQSQVPSSQQNTQNI